MDDNQDKLKLKHRLISFVGFCMVISLNFYYVTKQKNEIDHIQTKTIDSCVKRMLEIIKETPERFCKK